MAGTIKILLILSELMLAFGLVGISVIILRKIPVLASLPDRPEVVLPRTPILKKLQKKFIEIRESDLKIKFLSFVEKEIRKFRLFFLKADNLLMSLIKKIQGQAEIWRVRSKNFLIRQQAKKLERIRTLEKIEREEVKELISEAKNGRVVQSARKEEKSKLTASNELLKQKKNDFLEDSAEKERELIKLIAKNPKNGKYYYQLGIFYVRQKNFQDAKKCFQQVLKLDQENEEAQRRLGEIKKLEE